MVSVFTLLSVTAVLFSLTAVIMVFTTDFMLASLVALIGLVISGFAIKERYFRSAVA
jgi:hypothetical protein